MKFPVLTKVFRISIDSDKYYETICIIFKSINSSLSGFLPAITFILAFEFILYMSFKIITIASSIFLTSVNNLVVKFSIPSKSISISKSKSNFSMILSNKSSSVKFSSFLITMFCLKLTIASVSSFILSGFVPSLSFSFIKFDEKPTADSLSSSNKNSFI